jgi:hydrophobic/amphiphilic exporter-1 (mainly G- bacteria), HAE1 family
MNLPSLAVRRPVTTMMLLVSVVVLGGIAVKRMPLAFLPELDAPFIGVRIPYPNSSPAQIEKDIAKPVEEVLATLPAIKKMSSSSSADSAQIQLLFDWGQPIDIVRMQVSEKMDQIKPSLPAGVGEILIFSFNTSDIPVVEARIAAAGVDLSTNYDLLEARVMNRLRRVPGVARVDMNGAAPREINIDLGLDQIKSHRVDLGPLIQRLQGASSNLVLGQATEGGMRYTVRAPAGFKSVEEIENLRINPQGLRLGDIAEIRYEEPPIPYGRHLDGSYAVGLDVFKESTANTVEVVRSVMKVINEDIGNDPLLQGIKVFTWNDQADQITGGLRGLTQAGLIGGFLAIIILYLFLRRFRATLIVSMAIPFSIIAACGVMYFLGKSLNILSMMGLMLGVGMLIDNAIVVLESIDRRQRVEPDPKKAALTGARAVAMAVAASTLTTLIVFMPLMVGSRSELTVFLREVGISISLALLCSLAASLTLIPLVSAHFLKRDEPKPVRWIGWVEERYVRILAWTLHHKAKTLGLIVVALILTIVPFAAKLVETGMFSATKNDRIRVSYDFTDFVYKSKSEEIVTAVEEYLSANSEEFMVAGLYSYFGENEAGTWITLSRANLSDRQVKDLRKKIRERMPEIAGVKIFFNEDAEEGGDTTSFAVRFFGQDSGVLASLGEEAARRLETVPGIVDVNTGANRGRQEIQVTIDRPKAAQLGLSAEELSQIFGFTLGGMRLSRFNAGDREVETWLALRLEDRTSLEDLKKIQIRTVGGREVLLSDVATFDVVTTAQSIRRENRKVRSAVRASYEGKEWQKTRKEISELMDTLQLPAGYSWSWDDRILEQDSQGKEMMINLLLALALVYIVMASLFESLTQPFAILFSIPFALPGAVWFLAATRTPFNMMAQIGLLILVGIVVNNGIVLLDHVNQLRKQGLSREEAILQGGRDRLRPILMTASTTICGLLPLAIGGTNVSGLFYFPLARTVMGGLISSTFLTLLILPYVSVLVESGSEWFGKVWRTSSPAAPTLDIAADTTSA